MKNQRAVRSNRCSTLRIGRSIVGLSPRSRTCSARWSGQARDGVSKRLSYLLGRMSCNAPAGDIVENMLFEPIRLTAVLRGIRCGVLVCVGLRELTNRDAVAQDDGRLRPSLRDTIARWRPLRGNSLERVLNRESEFDLTGHPASWGALVAYLKLRGYVGLGLSISIEIDQLALTKQGARS